MGVDWGEFRDGINSAGGALGGFAEDQVEAAGQVVDDGLDVLAGAAREVGADGVARVLDGLGDTVASATGGAVDELELGQTDDPTELVRGEIASIHEASTTLASMASAVESTGEALRAIDATDWSGAAAEGFRAVHGKQPGLWFDGADAMTAASRVLDGWGHAVESAQGRAREAIELWEAAQREEAAKKSWYNSLDAEQRAATSLPDTWTTLREDARGVLRRARADRDGAASRAAGALLEAAGTAPEAPPFLQQLAINARDAASITGHSLHSVGMGAAKGVSGIVQFIRQVNATDPYNLTHPAEYMSGLSTMAAGITVTAADPGAAASSMFSAARRNPTEFVGSLIPDAALAAATAGAGGAVTAGRLGMRAVDTATDAGTGLRIADDVLADPSHRDSSHSPAAPEPNDAPPPREDSTSGVAPAADPPAPDPVPHDVASRAEADRGAHDTAVSEGPVTDRTADQNTESRDPVDIATGEFLLPETDLVLPGVLPLVLKRRHRSEYRFGRWFGTTWSSTLDMRLAVEDSGVTFLGEDGVMLAYPHPGVDTPVMPASGQRWPLARTEAGGYRVEDPDREIVWHFAPDPQLGGLDVATGSLAISAITDRHGNRTLFRHDADGAPAEIVHSGGYRVTVTCDAGRITGLSVADGDELVPVRRFGYTAGALTSVINGSGGETTFTYDDAGRMTSWTDSLGASMANTYDHAGRVVEQHGTGGMLDSRYEYAVFPDGSGRSTTVTDSLGATTIYGFDADLRQRDVVTADGGRTHIDFNERRDPLRVIQPDRAVTEYRYTPDGDVARIVRPDGEIVTVEYAARRRPSEVRLPDGSRIRREWDASGLLAAEIGVDGARTEYSYDTTGAIAAIVTADGARTLVESDAAGLPIAVTDPMGTATRVERDGFGRPVAETDELGNITRYRWNADGKLMQRAHPDGTAESWRHDGEGNLVEHTNAAGAATRYEHGPFDVLLARHDPDGTTTTYSWDTERRMTAVTAPTGHTWQYKHDAAGRVAREIDYNGIVTEYTHDQAGRVTQVRDGAGTQRTHDYDVLGRLVAVESSDGAFRRYEHDAMGRVVSAQSNDHVIERAYSATGLLARETVDEANQLQASYDMMGRRTRVRTSRGGDTTWRHDSVGRAVAADISGQHVSLTHDKRGMLTGWRAGEITIDREIDTRGRTVGQDVTAHKAGLLNLGDGPSGRQALLRQDRWDYRGDGYVTSHAVTNGPSVPHVPRMTVDAAGRITELGSETYAYDGLGNITEATDDSARSGSAGSGASRREHRGTLLVRDGRRRYHYDGAGRLVETAVRKLSGGREAWQYTWDGLGQLSEVVTPDGTTWRYTYDAFGRRMSKFKVGPDSAPSDVVRFVWDGTRLAEEHTAGQVIRFEYLPGSHVPLAQVTGHTAGSRMLVVVPDLVGSPVGLADPASGEMAGSARSSLWGAAVWTGEASTPLRLPGQYLDAETGWHYNLHRYYDPATGRYASPDPLGLAPSANQYAYPHNPMVWSDPLGLMPQGCWENVREQRQAYVDSARELSRAGLERIDRGEDPAVVAREVVEARNQLKAETREHMPGLLNRWAEWRNMRHYGDPLGAGYEDFKVDHPLKSDIGIIEGAGRTNDLINRILGVS